MRMQGKSVIVTGAASGIGAEIARTFAREGAKLCVADIDAAGAARIAAEIGGGAIGVCMDVTSEEQVESGVETAVRELGGVDVLVSNAGVQHIDTIAEVSFANWRRILAIHLDGGFLTTRACLRRMVEQRRGGAIILMGSVHSKEASVQKGPYVAAKHGLIGLTKVIALEGAEHGVTCNALCPGYVLTPLVRRQIPEQAKARGLTEDAVIRDVLLAAQPTKRFVTVDEVAGFTVFLCSDAASSVTGAALPIEGGWTAH